jgi:hypothetical protein
MKTNKELNTAYDKAQTERVRPKDVEYNYKDLEAVIRQWITGSK